MKKLLLLFAILTFGCAKEDDTTMDISNSLINVAPPSNSSKTDQEVLTVGVSEFTGFNGTYHYVKTKTDVDGDILIGGVSAIFASKLSGGKKLFVFDEIGQIDTLSMQIEEQTPEYFINYFLEDLYQTTGEDHRDLPIDIQFDNEYPESYGSAFGSCDDTLIDVYINAKHWENLTRVQKLWLIYHEMGHDVLNLDHTPGDSYFTHPETGEIVIVNWNIMTSHASVKVADVDNPMDHFITHKNRLFNREGVETHYLCN